MTQHAIKYRLIKKKKHTGARLGELILSSRYFSHADVYAWETLATVKTMSQKNSKKWVPASF